MISNLATTVFCCINEMFHFQRDCQDILKIVPSLLCNTPLPQKSALLCIFQENNGIIFYIGRYDFQQVLKCLFSSSFFVLSCSQDYFLVTIKCCKFYRMVKQGRNPLNPEQELNLKYCMHANHYFFFWWGEGVRTIIYNKTFFLC